MRRVVVGVGSLSQYRGTGGLIGMEISFDCVICKKLIFPTETTFICTECGYLNSMIEIDYFSYFAMPINHVIDLDLLEFKYIELMNIYHPDRFIGATEEERMNALVHSSFLNKAYATLRAETELFAYMYFLMHAEDILKNTEGNGNSSLLIEFMEVYEELEHLENRESIKIFRDRMIHMKKDLLSSFSVEDFSNKVKALNIFTRLKYIDRIVETATKKQL